MKICFVVSDLQKEGLGTTVVLTKKAYERGHEVYLMEVGGFNFIHGAAITLRCKKIPKSFTYDSTKAFLISLKTSDIPWTSVSCDEIDILFLRNNPTEETMSRHWAEHSGLAFARIIQQRGTLVLNDANAMAHSFIDKMYFEELPKIIKPDSIVTRDRDAILEFWEKCNRKVVLKPLEGSGGQNIYLIEKERHNFNQIIDHLRNQGYIIAQEFLPQISAGDVRVFLMNGKLLQQDGEYALIRRKSKDKAEFRSNLSLGGLAEKAELTPEIEKIVELTAPKLIKDGFFLVGLDVVDDKLIEINCMSPGALECTEEIGLPDFTDTVIEAIERKVEYQQHAPNDLTNAQLATLE